MSVVGGLVVGGALVAAVLVALICGLLEKRRRFAPIAVVLSANVHCS